MRGLNWTIILYNLAEAREQIQKIEQTAKQGEKISEVEFQTMLEHAYHHLNFAWNIRHASTKRYRHLTDNDFDEWSKFPKEIEEYSIGEKEEIDI
jgi:hypothetical protein